LLHISLAAPQPAPALQPRAPLPLPHAGAPDWYPGGTGALGGSTGYVAQAADAAANRVRPSRAPKRAAHPPPHPSAPGALHARRKAFLYPITHTADACALRSPRFARFPETGATKRIRRERRGRGRSGLRSSRAVRLRSAGRRLRLCGPGRLRGVWAQCA
jgi:hypothetical protein